MSCTTDQYFAVPNPTCRLQGRMRHRHLLARANLDLRHQATAATQITIARQAPLARHYLRSMVRPVETSTKYYASRSVNCPVHFVYY